MQQDWAQALVLLASLCTGAFTLLLALATVALALETKAGRVRAEFLAKHAAFRSALNEIAQNIANLHGWYPQLEPKPTELWLRQTFTFDSLTNLLSRVVIHPDIWQRGIAITRNLRAAEIELKTQLVAQEPEKAKVVFYHLDIYLKQLARYVAIEMERAGVSGKEAAALLSTSMLRPVRWGYGDSSLSPEAIAAGMEVHPIAPFSALPKEPDDHAFDRASLAQLIKEAQTEVAAILGG